MARFRGNLISSSLLIGLLGHAGVAIAADIPFADLPAALGSLTGVDTASFHDLDRDGDLDAVVASSVEGTVSWLAQGAPGAPWGETVIDDALAGAAAVAVADLDQDGDLDVVAVGVDADTVRWYENLAGNGSSWFAQDVTTSEDGASAVQAADIDGDGDLDLVVAACLADRITYWANTPGIGFSAVPIEIAGSFDGANALATRDIDGDGRIDVVGTARDGDAITWFRNTLGDGSIWTPTAVDGAFDQPTAVQVADVDGDGTADVLATGDRLAWWTNTAMDGSAWVQRDIATDIGRATDAVVADLDGDGDLDAVAVVAGVADGLHWFDNLGGDGETWTRVDLPSPVEPRDVALIDLDQDGDLDVGVAASGKGTVVWVESQAVHRDAGFRSRLTLPDTIASRAATATDFDRDGDLDVLVAGNRLELLVNNGAPLESDWSNGIIPSTITSVGQAKWGDLDRDGRVDFVVADRDRLLWFRNPMSGSPSEWTEHVVAAYPGVFDLVVADMDHDGDLDVAGLSSSFEDTVTWFESNGSPTTGAWVEHQVTDDLLAPFELHVADLDGDADLDVVVPDFGDEAIVWFENAGPTGIAWAKREIVGAGFGDAAGVRTADIDRDGDLDAIGVSMYGRKLSWFENDGTPADGGWLEHTILDPAPFPTNLAVGDADGDGDVDVVFATGASGVDLTMALNDGSPLDGGWTLRPIRFGARRIEFFDIDADGQLDLLGADGAQAHLWPNRGGSFALEPTIIVPTVVAEGQAAAALAIQVVYRGQAGDFDLALRSVELSFRRPNTNPLSTPLTAALIERVEVYLDQPRGDAPGQYDAEDVLVGTQEEIRVDDDGALSIPVDDDAVVVSLTDPALVFVVFQLTGDAASQVLNRFRVVHTVSHQTTGEVTGASFPVVAEFVPSGFPSDIVLADTDADGDGIGDSLDICFGDNSTGDADSDGVCADQDGNDDDPNVGVALFTDRFESGDTSAWSVTVP